MQIYPPSYVGCFVGFFFFFCMLMSAPGIVTQEIKQVGATVGGEEGVQRDKQKIRFNIFLASLSLCCSFPTGKFPQGKLQTVSPAPPHPKCFYCVPQFSRFGGGLGSLLKYLMNCLRNSYSLYFFLNIFLNIHLLLCYSFVSYFCLFVFIFHD